MTLTSIELFTGAGGLALGVHQAGFRHLAVAEYDRHAVETLRLNRAIAGLDDVEIERTNVADVDWSPFAGRVDLLAGGVPCQPFSLGGRHRGHEDARNLFPEMLRAVRDIAPAAVLVENVKGLLRSSFAPYFAHVLRQLQMPELSARAGELWHEHDARLIRESEAYRRRGDLLYTTRHQLIQAADYGVPQLRERVFIVAYRADIGRTWRPPDPTHSESRLVHEMYGTREYWDEHGVPRRRPPRDLPAQIELGSELRWRTVRDALSGLPEPMRHRVPNHGAGHREVCHWANPGARPYHGHEGSDRDWPAKTLKAGVHGVPGGENMLRNSNGSVRYFSVREAARIQTFPDDYHFSGTWGEAFRQIGNAVPVLLASVVARQVAATLHSAAREAHAEQRSLVASG
ncbi:MAG TPA: DNA cytosine methyltransferase [Candidatus Limnocylindria bacterium]|nr:DNA cytosine methyltransferase [Candidatus Limnocylindria bacterium]